MTTADVNGRARPDAARRSIGEDGPVGHGSVLDLHCTELPTTARAVDIFAGSWTSTLPGRFGVDTGGVLNLFEDDRIAWMVEALGGVTDQRILELGPLEGGHTWALEALHGAGEIVAIESNQRAYLRCLVAKEIVRTTRSRFLLGDFNRYLAESGERFDLVVASGVLYHMDEPARHIELLCGAADVVFVWTHHYDRERIESRPELARKFSHRTEVDHGGYAHTVYRQDYLDALGWDGFCGAGRPSANWLTLDDITALFGRNGFAITDTAFEQPDHPNGPALAFVARRVRPPAPGSGG